MGVVDERILKGLKLLILSFLGFFVIAESGLFTFIALMYFYIRMEDRDKEIYRERNKEFKI